MTRFEEEKKRALERLQRRGADEEVVTLLDRINRVNEFFTTSSCSGRIVMIWLPEVGAKREARFVGKWHRAIETADVMVAMGDVKSSKSGDVWLLTQSPILHVACKGLENAAVLLQIALESGFKYSGIKTMGETTGKVMVEIMSTERMDVPLASNGTSFYEVEYLNFIVLQANFLLRRGKAKLARFERRVQELR